MTRGEALDRIMVDFDNLDNDLSLWTWRRSVSYKDAYNDLKKAVVALILASEENDGKED